MISRSDVIFFAKSPIFAVVASNSSFSDVGYGVGVWSLKTSRRIFTDPMGHRVATIGRPNSPAANTRLPNAASLGASYIRPLIRNGRYVGHSRSLFAGLNQDSNEPLFAPGMKRLAGEKLVTVKRQCTCSFHRQIDFLSALISDVMLNLCRSLRLII
jgi:hypothetical protein